MRTKKSLLNMTFSLLTQFISIVCGLITPRLILTTFGSSYNGVINSVAQFLSLVAVLRLGVAGATRVALYKTLASNDTLGTSKIVKATKVFMRKISVIILVYVGALMILYPMLSHNELNKIDCVLLIGIVSISTIAEYLFGITNITLLSADQSEYISSIVNMVALVANTIITAILIYFRCNIFVVKLGGSIVFLIAPFLLNVYVKRKYRLIHNCSPDYSALKGRKTVAFHSIANIIHSNTDIVLLTLFTDAKLISVYTVYYMIVGKLKSFLQAFTSGMEGAFGNMIVKNEHTILEEAFSAFECLVYFFTTVCFSCATVLIMPFVSLYTKDVFDVNYIRMDFALLIIITEAIFCFRQPYLIIVQAAGKYEETKKGAIVEAIVNIMVSVVLLMLIGINGVIIGTLLANLIRTVQYVFFTSKIILKRRVILVVRRILVSFFSFFIVVIIHVLFKFSNYEYTTWGIWVIYGGITFIVSCLITFAMNYCFYKKDVHYLFHKFYSLFKRRAE